MPDTRQPAKPAAGRSTAERPAATHASSGQTGRAAPQVGAQQPSRPTPHQKARRDRGEETREQLIMAGLEVFGRVGFEGASTREIARAAGVNLAAIVYHFGGKEQLYLAIAEYIAGCILERIAPVAMGGPAPTDPAAARTRLFALIHTFVDIILGEDEAEQWARFILREQLQPTSAFDLIYGFMGNMIDVVTALLATATSRPEDDETIRLRVITVVGQVLVFRMANALVLRRMAWNGIGESERGKIKRVVVENLTRILDSEAEG